MTFEGIVLDSEGVVLVGPTMFEGHPAHGVRLAVAPRTISWRLDPDELELAAPTFLTVFARCERRRGDGVWVFRRVEDFRPT